MDAVQGYVGSLMIKMIIWRLGKELYSLLLFALANGKLSGCFRGIFSVRP